MTQIHELELRGCSPDPLMSYLKALGIFRLVSEQADRNARARWQNDTFYLHSTLDRDGLTDFFLDEYSPTPIVSPWNKSSTITSRKNFQSLESLLELEQPRFRLWHEVVSISRHIFLQYPELTREQKQVVLGQCRARFPDEVLDWLDATYILTTEGPKYPPLLGTGGVDGRLEFSNNFMQNLVLALGLDGKKSSLSAINQRIQAALFNEGSPMLIKNRSNGFFNPSSVGGKNATVGFDTEPMTNPWDYVLMFEGALIFAGAAARRLAAQGTSKAVFPFTVDNSAAGYGTSSDSEYGDSSRAEFWAPLWERPASLRELELLMSEGRAQLGRRQVSSGADFARSISGLGTERGVSQFQRYGFLVRNGLAYLAAPLGRFYSDHDNRQDTAKRANVLFDLDSWLDSLRRAASGRNAPAELGAVRRRVDNAIIEFCQRGQPRDLQDVLVAIGQAERWISKSGIRDTVSPLRNLSRDWLEYAYNDSAEFRLARAMASILSESKNGGRVGPIRENLEPAQTQPRVKWENGSVSHVWKEGEPLSNMLSVLQRRCMEGRMRGLALPPLNSAYSARLSDIVSFLNGEVDVQRIVNLVLPLSFIPYWRRSEVSRQTFSPPSDLPSAYATMKLTLLPDKFACPEFGEDREIRMEPRMLAMLRAGRVRGAYEVASRRLIASGLRPISDTPGISDRSEAGRRLAAALLFPIDSSSYSALAERALRKPEDKNSQIA